MKIEPIKPKAIYLITMRENLVRMAKAATVPAIAFLGLNYLGVHIGKEEALSAIGNIKEAAYHAVPFTAGLVSGVGKNLWLINSTLKNLHGKTEPGTYEAKRQEKDGTVVAKIKCVDARRINKTGGAVPGSYGILGAEFINLMEAAVVAGVAPDNIFGSFATGYLIGSNLLTFGYSHLNLFKEIITIARKPEFKGHRIKLQLKDHWKGCGAQGFTNMASYWLKFKAHKLTWADLVALPNEAISYIYVNGILAPAVAGLTNGRISLSAVSRHSHMN